MPAQMSSSWSCLVEWVDAAPWIMRIAAHAVSPQGAVNDGAASDFGGVFGASQAMLAQVGKAADVGICRLVAKGRYDAPSLPWAVT